jgi:hypothetical protein
MSSITPLYGGLRAHPGWIEVKVKDRARSVPDGRLLVLYSDSRLLVLYSDSRLVVLYSESRLVVLYSDASNPSIWAVGSSAHHDGIMIASWIEQDRLIWRVRAGARVELGLRARVRARIKARLIARLYSPKQGVISPRVIPAQDPL